FDAGGRAHGAVGGHVGAFLVLPERCGGRPRTAAGRAGTADGPVPADGASAGTGRAHLRSRVRGQLTVQDSPLTVNSSGLPLDPFEVPLKPMSIEPPGAMEPFHGIEVAVTRAPFCAQVALQPWSTVCPDGKVKPSSQLLHAVSPVLVSRTAAVKPPGQSVVRYSTSQAPETGGSSSSSVVKLTLADWEKLPAAS